MISVAYAQTAGQQGGGSMTSLFLMMLIFGAFYFFMIRPQQKKAKEHQAMVNTLKRNDEVITAGGILGKVTSINEQYVYIEIAPRVEIGMQRAQILNVLPKGTIKESRRDEPNAVSDNKPVKKDKKKNAENVTEKVIEKVDDSQDDSNVTVDKVVDKSDA